MKLHAAQFGCNCKANLCTAGSAPSARCPTQTPDNRLLDVGTTTAWGVTRAGRVVLNAVAQEPGLKVSILAAC